MPQSSASSREIPSKAERRGAVASKRVALVTGSGRRRVGWYVAEALARRGYDLALHYRTSEAEARQAVEEMKRLAVEAVAFRADLREEADVRAMVRGAL